MNPVVPPDMLASAAQTVIYFVTVAAALITFLVATRA